MNSWGMQLFCAANIFIGLKNSFLTHNWVTELSLTSSSKSPWDICQICFRWWWIILSLPSTTAPSCVALLMLREFCHSPPACWESSCSHRCCCRRRCPWPSRWWSLAGFVFGPGSRRSRRGRASGRPCRNTPGPSSRSQWTGSSKGCRAGLWSTKQDYLLCFLLIWHRRRSDLSIMRFIKVKGNIPTHNSGSYFQKSV